MKTDRTKPAPPAAAKPPVDLYARIRAFKRQARHMAAMTENFFEDGVAFERASGHCECNLCGLIYFDHPQGSNGLVLICDGTFKKL